jgi:hypothetical protein
MASIEPEMLGGAGGPVSIDLGDGLSILAAPHRDLGDA